MLSARFQLHVPKPVDPAELVAAVAALASREIRAALSVHGLIER